MRFFFHKTAERDIGSERIYIDNLSYWLLSLKKNTKVSNKIEPGFDVYILSKFSQIGDLQTIQQYNQKSIIGIIHPNDTTTEGRKKLFHADFAIVGSIEEMDYYYEYHDKLFRFPQIERISVERKKHLNSEKVLIGYHGNLEHLQEAGVNFKNAIEKLNDEINLELIVVYDNNLGEWKKNRPKINISTYNWSMENMINKMKNVDIGVVPCVNNNFMDSHYKKSNFFLNLFKKYNSNTSRINDYLIQFKATSNAGRAFVFHQLGIPVIADFWPSHFELLSNNKNGRLAHYENSWYIALKDLSNSANLRQELSDNCYKEFVNKYDPLKFTSEFYDFSKRIFEEK